MTYIIYARYEETPGKRGTEGGLASFKFSDGGSIIVDSNVIPPSEIRSPFELGEFTFFSKYDDVSFITMPMCDLWLAGQFPNSQLHGPEMCQN